MKLRTKLPQQLTLLFTQKSWDHLLECITLLPNDYGEYTQHSSGILRHDGTVLSVDPEILFFRNRLYLMEGNKRLHLNLFFPSPKPLEKHEQALEFLIVFRLEQLLTAAYYFPDVVMKHATNYTCVHVA